MDSDDSSQAKGSDRASRRTAMSRRYTTMEGWRDARASVHAAAGIGLWMLAPSPQFDPDVVLDDDITTRTRASVSMRRRSSAQSANSRSLAHVRRLAQQGTNNTEQSIPENPFDDTNTYLQTYQSPFDDTAYPVPGQESFYKEQDSPPPTQSPSDIPPEEPYHVFSRKQKWFVVVTIGLAGLFSGLSSNIYFPSLDAIAKVRQPSSPPHLSTCVMLTIRLGPQRFSPERQLDNYFLLDHTGNLSINMGLSFGRTGAPANLHCILHGLHHRQHCPQLYA